MTLEAFADTIIPGQKRYVDDHAIAGVECDGGAVAAGAVELLEHPAGGIAPALDTIVVELNEYAESWAHDHNVSLDGGLPAFVALTFEGRSAVVQELTDPAHPEKQMWVGAALFCNMAFDSAAHLSTAEALSASHPGLTAMRFDRPDPDGLWRYTDFSYGRQLANPHPNTTATGSPS
ncbi:DUF5987 family protein [Micromonospora sediminicola]|uniref:DUF5987 family protein n=1 Tax=Micromonospora sediminicola TaxID=946078 RepID=UPI0033D504A4